jgi:sulfur relay (sulfurtransferase) DsrF/TusC family protein
MKVLQIVETAYRATCEEQDDTVIWIAHAMRGAGADLGVLLAGNAVNYVAADQDASGLTFGAWRQTQPPALAQDLAALIRKDVPVYCVKEDLAERGLLESKVLEGIVLMSRAQTPRLFSEYDQVWRW